MSVPQDTAHRFLAEWYQAELLGTPLADVAGRLIDQAAAARSQGTAVSVVLTVASPNDEMVFGVFCADTVEAVWRVCRDAGCPPDRITGDVNAYIVAGGTAV
ncbi:hypothetical protein ACTXG7_01005 [Mycolicibacterium sp. Dal123E01]|uniref:hypothetical protein n=1 Tax=Mycolicibacterium sp. Dal123E01 TaxID=3457578 RepID=UPI00403EB629